MLQCTTCASAENDAAQTRREKQEATMQLITSRVLSTLLAVTISSTLFSAVLV